MNMKKRTKLFLLVVVLVASVSVVFAQTKKTETTGEKQKSCFVDANNNKICDKHENGTCKKACDGKGQQANAECKNKNNKENCTQSCGNKKAQCKNKSKECAGTNCKNFVDENKNGVCDRKESVKK